MKSMNAQKKEKQSRKKRKLSTDQIPKMGRPRRDIDEKDLREFLEGDPTLKEAAAYFNVSEDSIERRCKEWGDGCTYAEFKHQCMAPTRYKLRRKALELAMSGNTAMLNKCLNVLCGWSDRIKLEGGDNPIRTETKVAGEVEVRGDGEKLLQETVDRLSRLIADFNSYSAEE